MPCTLRSILLVFIYATLVGGNIQRKCVDDMSVVDGFGNTCSDYANQPQNCNLFDFNPFFIAQHECCACSCSNDDTVTDDFGQTCSGFYDTNPQNCGDFDTPTFVASNACCACKVHLPSPSLNLDCGSTVVSSSSNTFGLFGLRGQLFEFTLPSLARVTISTCLRQTQFDTVLYLFQEGNLLEANDDLEEGSTCSSVTRLLAPGRYQSLVSGFDGQFGRFGITLECDDTCGALLDSINADCAVDGCYSAQATEDCCDRFSTMFTTCDLRGINDADRASLLTRSFCGEAVRDFGSLIADQCVDYHLSCGDSVTGIVSDANGATVTLTVGGSTPASVLLSTCNQDTTMDTVVSVNDFAGAIVAENDDGCSDGASQSIVNVLLQPGTHGVRVQGNRGAQGAFTLSATCDFTAPGELGCNKAVLATLGADQSRTHALTVTTDSIITLSTCSSATVVDTTITLLTSSGTEVASNDDASSVVTCSTIRSRLLPGSYMIRVDGFLDSTGDYLITMECEKFVGFQASYQFTRSLVDINTEVMGQVLADLLSVPSTRVVLDTTATTGSLRKVQYAIQTPSTMTIAEVDKTLAQLSNIDLIAAALTAAYASLGIAVSFSSSEISVVMNFISPAPTPMPKPRSDTGGVNGTVGGVVGGFGAIGVGASFGFVWISRSRRTRELERGLAAERYRRQSMQALL